MMIEAPWPLMIQSCMSHCTTSAVFNWSKQWNLIQIQVGHKHHYSIEGASKNFSWALNPPQILVVMRAIVKWSDANQGNQSRSSEENQAEP